MRSARWTLGGAVLVACLWYGLGWVLAVNRGIDLTDEALYLLSADPPQKFSSYGLPYGWCTGILFGLVGHDIALFRQSAALLILMAGGWLGFSISRVLAGENHNADSSAKVLGAGLVLSGAVGALSIYSGMLRSPGYNWLNLFGLYLALGAIFNFWQIQGSPSLRSVRQWILSIVLALTLVTSLLAKPSTPIFLILSAMPAFFMKRGSKGAGFLAMVAAAVILWIGLFLWIGAWPWNFPRVLMSAFTQTGPGFMPEQTVCGALLSLLKAPFKFLEELKWCLLLLLAAGVGALLWARFFPSSEKTRIVKIYFYTGYFLICGLGITDLSGWFGVEKIERWINPAGVTAGLWLVLGICFTAGITRATPRPAPVSLGAAGLGLVLPLFCAPFIFGFGSGHGAYRQAFLAAGFLPVLAQYLACVFFGTTTIGRNLVWLITAWGIIVMATILKDSRECPYRTETFDRNTMLTEYGPREARLFLAPELAGKLSELKGALQKAGFGPDQNLLPLASPWSSGLSYHIGGLLPQTLILTIWGYETSRAVAIFNAEKTIHQYRRGDFWILAGSMSQWVKPIAGPENPEIKKAQNEVIRYVCNKTGQAFPQDFEQVMALEGVEILKPKQQFQAAKD